MSKMKTPAKSKATTAKKKPLQKTLKFKSPADELTHHGFDAGRGKNIILVDPAALIIPPKEHPLWDPRGDDPVDEGSDFFKDLSQRGVHTPVQCIKDGHEKDGTPRYLVVDGRKRVTYLRAVNSRRGAGPEPFRIQFTVEPLSMGEAILRALSRNTSEAESVFSLAVKIGNALAQGRTHEEVGRAIRKSVPTVKEYELVLGFHPDVQQAFHTRQLLTTNITDFATVPYTEQPGVLSQVLGSGARKSHEVAAAVGAARDGKEYKPPARKKTLGRPKIEAAVKVLTAKVEADSANPTTRMQAALLSPVAAFGRFILGEDGALDAHPELKALLTGEEPAEAAALKVLAQVPSSVDNPAAAS